MPKEEIETFYPTSRPAWRNWLAENHNIKRAVWIVYIKKGFQFPTLTWDEAVEEALCFGWIDGVRKPLDDRTFMQFFCKRKPRSTWSKINKIKIEQLIEKGVLTASGHNAVAIAKENGSWCVLDSVEELILPTSLEREFESRPGSKDFFLSLSKSSRKAMLQWIVLAKQEQTKQRRVIEIAEQASLKRKPKQF